MKKRNITFVHRLLRPFALMVMVVFTLVGSTHSSAAPLPQEDEPFTIVQIDSEAFFIDASEPADRSSGEAKHDKIDSTLLQLTFQARNSIENAFSFAESHLLRLSGESVHSQITTSPDNLAAAIQAIEKSGGEVTGISHNKDLIQAWLPINALQTITENESIYYIRQPNQVVLFEEDRAGTYLTEGLSVINGSTWHTEGYTGTGVKIAVIDGGFEGYFDLLGSELPNTVTVANFVDGEDPSAVGNSASPHGTACAEIIHDIAPDADLFLVKIATNFDLEEAVDWAIGQGVDIISTSLGWYSVTPGDGTGEFEDLVQEARNAGILWLTAAGNDREAHWGGLFNDPENDGYHNYEGDANINPFSPEEGYVTLLPAGFSFQVYLRWDDWTNVDQDYDLFLYRNIYLDDALQGWERVGWSEDWQNGDAGQQPVEYIGYTTTSPQAAYGFVIERYSSDRNVNFELFAPKVAPLNFQLYDRSLANLADAPSAMTVAALNVASPYEQEPYSSQGPTNGPGGTATGGFTKPDISGFANVATASYGTESPFNGTSAATPHVAGAAALVLSANPLFSPGQIQNYLETNAVDMGYTDMDNAFGWGRLFLGDPPSEEPKEDWFIYLPLIVHQ